MTKPIFYTRPWQLQELLHYHVTDGKRTYAWSRSLERAQERAREDNKKSGVARARVFECRVFDCYAITGKERD